MTFMLGLSYHTCDASYTLWLILQGPCRSLKCDVIILQLFSIRSFKPYHAIHTAAVRTWAKFQIASINKSEDREVLSFTQSHTNLSYLVSVPNFRNKY